MEKEPLIRFEHQCIQDEPPWCTAACPFHVDVKAFLTHMAVNAFDKAFKVLERSLPLPEIMARICDHPCEDACIRGNVDDPVAVGSLERVCADSRSRQKKYFSHPAKDACVAVWGTGLSSLTAAWDLSLKGYRVTLFEQASIAGGPLRRLPSQILSESVLEAELERLKGFGAGFCFNTAPGAFQRRESEFRAVYIGLDAEGFDELPGNLDAFSLREGEGSRFYGGFSAPGASLSPVSVHFAFQGRKAATSIDRMLSEVSMTAGREREGPFSTRLDTDISRITPVPRTFNRTTDDSGHGAKTPVSAEGPDQASDHELAVKEAGRCHQCDCSRCLRACNTYLEAFGGHPGKYAREVYNNLAIVMGERKANLLINSCTLCGLCETVCPNDFSMADLSLAARQEMREAGRMPPSAHAFALDEMAHAMGSGCAFFSHAPGQSASDALFFPGCQLIGSAPEQAAAAWAWLREKIAPATGLMAGCCGAPAFWAGDVGLAEAALRAFKDQWAALGHPKVITACTSCTRMLETGLPDGTLVSLYTVMAEAGILPEAGPSGPAAVIDPCTAREEKPVRDAVRTLVGRAAIPVEELDASGELTECCGFGGLVFNANPGLADTIIRNRAAQADVDYIAYCAMCRDRLARGGKTCFHVLDLFWPEGSDPKDDPGFSRRRMNREAFKAARGRLGENNRLIGGTGDSRDSATLGSGRPLLVSPQVLTLMEAQFILLTDIRTVLNRYEQDHLPCFSRKENTIVSFRTGTVCFWVEFTEKGQDIDVLDAWCHRMEWIPSTAFVPGKPSAEHDPDVKCRDCGKDLAFFKNHVTYMGSRFDVDLPQCPGCGMIFISPELSRTRMAEVEQILEDK